MSVDKWSFTWMVRSEYSWLPVGRSSAVINDIWKESISLIFSDSSNGQWFGVFKQSTIKSNEFWIFLNLLERERLGPNRVCQNAPVIILDNAKTHTSNFTKNLINNIKLKVKHLSPYCPELALIEPVFRAIKAKLRNKYR